MATVTTITRKEIANLMSVSVKTVIRHEKDWKLDTCIVKTSRRPILYHEVKAKSIIAILSLCEDC